jgi:hypothetical protein
MGIALARDMHVANNKAAKDAALERNRQFHERILSVARWPDRSGGSHILAYGNAPEEAEANSLIGTPDEIMGKLEALRRNRRRIRDHELRRLAREPASLRAGEGTTPGFPGAYQTSFKFSDDAVSWTYKGRDCGGPMEGHGTAKKTKL